VEIIASGRQDGGTRLLVLTGSPTSDVQPAHSALPRGAPLDETRALPLELPVGGARMLQWELGRALPIKTPRSR